MFLFDFYVYLIRPLLLCPSNQMRITLGIECSSRQGSLALLKDQVVLAETVWTGEAVRHGVLFDHLDALLQQTGISCGEISLFAVGRGPGSFSGMRMSFAVAQALALPGRNEVRAISSGAALALAAARETGKTKIAVTGDARRGQLWLGLFEMDSGGSLRISTDGWVLVPSSDIKIPDGWLAVSPEADRLQPFIPQMGESRFPSARCVAELALQAGTSEPLEPLYMHPPVFVEPKFI